MCVCMCNEIWSVFMLLWWGLWQSSVVYGERGVASIVQYERPQNLASRPRTSHQDHLRCYRMLKLPLVHSPYGFISLLIWAPSPFLPLPLPDADAGAPGIPAAVIVVVFLVAMIVYFMFICCCCFCLFSTLFLFSLVSVCVCVQEYLIRIVQ